MKSIWRFYRILKRKVHLAKINILPKHHGVGLQRRGAQCNCIGLRPALTSSSIGDNELGRAGIPAVRVVVVWALCTVVSSRLIETTLFIGKLLM